VINKQRYHKENERAEQHKPRW